jgi:hypothetical protein
MPAKTPFEHATEILEPGKPIGDLLGHRSPGGTRLRKDVIAIARQHLNRRVSPQPRRATTTMGQRSPTAERISNGTFCGPIHADMSSHPLQEGMLMSLTFFGKTLLSPKLRLSRSFLQELPHVFSTVSVRCADSR